MSINLWVLSTAVTNRVNRGYPVDLVLDDIDTTSAPPPGPPPAAQAMPLVVQPNPATGSCALSFSLVATGQGSLIVLDAGGRRVRTLVSGEFAAGPHAPRWDGRDEAGHAMPGGVYFARLHLGTGDQTSRFVLLR
jgi:hypothetical protein